MLFHCPIDGQLLSQHGNALRCPAGHSYDLAKEGYCNLLLVQQKASLDPGDNKEMVEARRRFLTAGHFDPISAKLEVQMKELLAHTAAPRILDAGCGEGHYLGRLRQAFPEAELAGVDISKWAVKAAAKSHKGIAWAVASNKQLPFAANSHDLILCLFGFPFWESFRDSLRPGGHVLLVDPAPAHLLELRELIYEKVKTNHLSRIDGALDAGFRLEREEKLDFPVTLSQNAALQDLLAMTPHGYRISAEARNRIASLERLSTGASVVFRLLRSPGGE